MVPQSFVAPLDRLGALLPSAKAKGKRLGALDYHCVP